MKIAFVFPPMWTPGSDGSLQIWNRQVTTRLSKSCDVLVYSGLFSLKPHDCAHGVRYRRFSTRWDSRLVKYSQLIRKVLGIQRHPFSSDLWYPWYALKIALDLRNQDCDVVHIYNYPQFAALIKCLNPAIRVILNVHGELLTQAKFNNLEMRLSKLDFIISCSELCTKSIRTKFPQLGSRCGTIPMGISPDDLSRASRDSKADCSHPRRLLYVGRISPEKGVHVLLDAFELIIRRYPDATLTIVGPEWIAPRSDIADLCLERSVVESLSRFYEGSYLQKIKHNLSLHAARLVTFAGLVAHSDVPAYYANADIYVNASFYESFGMSIIEAMGAGLPVVAARGGAVPDLISDGHNGLLVDVANPSAIADAVCNLFEDAGVQKSISCAACQMVRNQFSWETICSALMDIYRDVLCNAPGSQEPAKSLEGGLV